MPPGTEHSSSSPYHLSTGTETRVWNHHDIQYQLQAYSSLARRQIGPGFCLVGMSCQVGNGIELEAVGLQFEPYRWRPCGVTWDSSRTVVVIKLRRTSALRGTRTRRRVRTWSSNYPIEVQHLRFPMLTFATKKLSTGANGQKENVASYFRLTWTAPAGEPGSPTRSLVNQNLHWQNSKHQCTPAIF